ncbi:senescence-associated protein (macronuclear) [Tetrahymena thermophila SB210]|uniref:Senescence-associated protein n=1 Tax=Tetrahymena thermophila (strain SB210) TaxID=312017 RepID=Q23CJ3_TETTS|nr:senescence-associated protein [Tetrahymena thermophila SB210]EAR94287.1 senescence-associated protein [Tetrahymena thermophila SB210]|eukprot:XP_001014532.1 senescence-associated protein [Tetrahymena thermophila SB210]
MQNQNNYAQLVLEIPNCALYNIEESSATLMLEAYLGIYEIKTMNTYFFKMKNWEYNFQKQIPVLKKQIGQQMIYVIPNMTGNYVLVLPSNAQEETISVLESFLENNSDFAVSIDQKQEVQEDEDLSASDDEVNHQNQITQQVINQIQMKQKDCQNLKAENLKTKLINFGERIAKRIEKRKERIVTRISRPRYIKIRPETLERIQKFSTFLDKIVHLNEQIVNKMVYSSAQIVQKLALAVGETKTGKRIKRNKVYCDIKDSVKKSVKSIITVYEGMVEAQNIVEEALKKASIDILTAKYGQQVGQLSNQAIKINSSLGQLS